MSEMIPGKVQNIFEVVNKFDNKKGAWPKSLCSVGI